MTWGKRPISERVEIRRKQGRAVEYAAAVPEARAFLTPDELRELDEGLAKHGSLELFLRSRQEASEKKEFQREAWWENAQRALFTRGEALPLTTENIGLALHNANKAAKREGLAHLLPRLYFIKEVVLAKAIREGLAVFVGWHRTETEELRDDGRYWKLELL